MATERKIGKCKQCGNSTRLSKRSLCTVCSHDNMLEQQKQLINKKGPHYDKWKEGLKKSIETDG